MKSRTLDIDLPREDVLTRLRLGDDLSTARCCLPEEMFPGRIGQAAHLLLGRGQGLVVAGQGSGLKYFCC